MKRIQTPHTYTFTLRGGRATDYLSEAPKFLIQGLVAGIEPGPHDHKMSRNPLCHCAEYSYLLHPILMLIFSDGVVNAVAHIDKVIQCIVSLLGRYCFSCFHRKHAVRIFHVIYFLIYFLYTESYIQSVFSLLRLQWGFRVSVFYILLKK